MNDQSASPNWFWAVLGFVALTALLSAIAAVALTIASPAHTPDKYEHLILMFSDTFKFCVAAIVGMIGGRSLQNS